MPHPAMLWVRERNAATGHDAAELACTYFADRPMVESQPRKFQGYRQGSYRSNPNRPYSRQDSIQEEQRAKEEKPTEKKSNDRVTWDKDRGPRCFACQKFGHIAIHCPDAKTVPKTEVHEGKLWELHQDGRLPVSEGFINGTKAKRLLRDTGCTLSHVHPRMLMEEYENEGDVTVSSIFGKTMVLPTTSMNLKLRGMKWRVRMAVNGLINYDALLGNDIPHLDEALLPRKDYKASVRDLRQKWRQLPRRSCPRPLTYKEATLSSAETSDSEQSSSSDYSPSELTEDSGTTETPPPSSDEQDSGTTETPPPSGGQNLGTTADAELSESGNDSLASLSDQVFQKASIRRKMTKAQRRLERQQYAHKWGTPLSLDGGKNQMRQLQMKDPSLATARSSTDKPDSLFY